MAPEPRRHLQNGRGAWPEKGKGREVEALKATSKPGAALCAVTLVACFAPGEAADVRVTIAIPTAAAGTSAAAMAAMTVRVLVVGMVWWLLLRRERQAGSFTSSSRTLASSTVTEVDVADANKEGWEVLRGDDDENDTRGTGEEGCRSVERAGTSVGSDPYSQCPTNSMILGGAE